MSPRERLALPNIFWRGLTALPVQLNGRFLGVQHSQRMIDPFLVRKASVNIQTELLPPIFPRMSLTNQTNA